MAKHMAKQPAHFKQDDLPEETDLPEEAVQETYVPQEASAPQQPEPRPQPQVAPREIEPAPSKHPKRGNLVSNLLLIVGVVLLVAAAVIFFNNQKNYQKIDEENERVAEYARLSKDGDEPPEVDWDALKAVNEDVVGWLQVPGTVINYPVYQTTNNEFYLDHAPDRSESIGGSVFLDYENKKPGMKDMQTIIYGHHMRNGSQFKYIADMENQELFDSVKTVWYVTEEKTYKLAPLFLYYANEGDVDIRQFDFEKDSEFREYLKKYLANAKAKRANVDEAIEKVVHILTLSTCNYEDGYGRSLLVLAPTNEIPGMPDYVEPKKKEEPKKEPENATAEEEVVQEEQLEEEQPQDEQPQDEQPQDEPSNEGDEGSSQSVSGTVEEVVVEASEEA